MTATDDIAAFLEFYPPPIVRIVSELRAVVRRAVPEAVERLRQLTVDWL